MVALHEPLDENVRHELAEYDELVAGLLARRGIRTREAAEAFLSPSYELQVGDPLTIRNMEKAAKRIARALQAGERISVWSDYDCDGIPGGVVLHDFLKKAGANFDNYIPHRHLEGYGVNVAGVEKLAKEGTKVLITVDSGIVDLEPIARAGKLGMDVIVTDHHIPGPVLPSAFAIVNPKQKGETYEFQELCGAGLAWKLVCAVLAVGRAEGARWATDIPEGWEKWLLDMAGLGTIADMVPLVGENRVIAKYGLIVMRKSPRLGLRALLKAARVDQRGLSEEDVGFMIAPRVNAASRMGNPRDAFELFTTEDETRAEVLAKELERVNRSRRASAGAITKAARERIKEREALGTLPQVLALGDPDWRPGLLGLVANTLAEEFERPVFLWGREGGVSLKGSCRAGKPGVSVVALMETAAHVFSGYGGHHASGGFTVKDEEVFSFEEKLCEAFSLLPPCIDAGSEARADAQISIEDATHALLSRVSRLAPFGMGNEKPVFALKELHLSTVSWFGKAEEHIKLSLTSNGFDHIEGIAFYAKKELGPRVKTLTSGGMISVLASLERDQFTRGRPVRLRLLSIS
ncbi:MAG: single-stranded-DNA-specific exonuclease RecJ [Minisyncoccia bacterium]